MMQPLLAVRIKDGIFIGNAAASRDAAFISMNKITHVINCAAIEAGNMFHTCGIRYLTLHWRDVPGVTALDNTTCKQIKEFIEVADEKGECVLIHSMNGMNRCCLALGAYLISKYKWNYDMVMSYMSVAHPPMKIKPHFTRQLRALSKRVGIAPQSTHLRNPSFQAEKDVLQNSHLNALLISHPSNAALQRHIFEYETRRNATARPAVRKLSFGDIEIESENDIPKRYRPEQSCKGILKTQPTSVISQTVQKQHKVERKRSPSVTKKVNFKQRLYEDLARGEDATQTGNAISLCAIGLMLSDSRISAVAQQRKRLRQPRRAVHTAA